MSRGPVFPAADGRAIAEALAARGHAIVEGALPPGCWGALQQEAEDLLAGGGAFAPGRIGQGGGTHREDLVRGDSLCWLDAGMPIGGIYLRWMDELRVALNRSLFLGLAAFDAHYAHYPQGAFYRTHLDCHAGSRSRSRVVSTVLYCNRDWPAGAGGELVIYDEQGRACINLAPAGGTLAVFLSADTRHEAKPADRPRWSIAGWFRGGD